MNQLDGLALVNAVADLTDLLGHRTTVDQFLNDLVRTVAEHMDADVCSVYLYDVEQDLLVLRATVGLNPSLVGHVRLRPGEGLTGSAFLNNRPLMERDAPASRLNKPVPDLGEEEYPEFLGVPIKRNDLGIGVLVLQYRRRQRTGDQSVRALRAIASYLAATLENAAALYEVHEQPTRPNDRGLAPFESGLLNGSSASRGIGIGIAKFLDNDAISGDHEVRRSLRQAVDLSAEQLAALQHQVEETLSDVASMIFSSHMLMLRDDAFVGRMIELEREGEAPLVAVNSVVEDFCRRFASIPDPRFQEKVQDVKDLGHRIVRNLLDQETLDGDYRGSVVIAHELFPSELVKLYLQRVEGLVFSAGGATSHIAILAQSLGLPLVATSDPRLFAIPYGAQVVVDAEDGKVAVGPTGEILSAYRARVSSARTRAGDTETIESPVMTADGVAVELLANVNLVKDARAAAARGAGGIGLYRSEFPFLIRNGFPTEEEQYTVYRRVIAEMDGRPVTFRTLDLGGDKLLSSQVGREDNPFLGFRGIRFLLAHRDLFREQLRAMLRAGDDAEIGIQFPMVTTLEEFLAARDEVESCIAELAADGLPHNPSPRLGVMVEIPAAVEIAAELAAAADFLSVGTNDLAMYTLAADRTNHRVAHLYRAIHPAVARTVARLADVVVAAGVPLSVCGASAADTAWVVFYLGIGIRTLSVDPAELSRVARVIRRVTIADARAAAEEMRRTIALDELSDLARRTRQRLEGGAG